MHHKTFSSVNTLVSLILTNYGYFFRMGMKKKHWWFSLMTFGFWIISSMDLIYIFAINHANKKAVMPISITWTYKIYFFKLRIKAKIQITIFVRTKQFSRSKFAMAKCWNQFVSIQSSGVDQFRCRRTVLRVQMPYFSRIENEIT